jgi:hypothetical protein
VNWVILCPAFALGVISLAGCGDAIRCEENVCPCTEQGVRHAIGEGGGPYRFECDGPTTIVTGAVIAIDIDVILDGDGNITLDANDRHRVLTVGPDVTATIEGMSITRGYIEEGDGGGIATTGTLTLNRVKVSGNTATFSGSGLFRGTGGGIYNQGTLTLNDSTVSDNTASWNGADDLFIRGGRGGGIDNEGGTVVLINSTVEGNAATHWGGGIQNRDQGTLTLDNSRVSGNTAGHRGGGIANDSRLVLMKSSVSTNTADHGGGIYNVLFAELTLTDSTVSDNAAVYTGGGIGSHAGPWPIGATASQNSAPDDKAGLSPRMLALTNSTVSGNAADYGGGLYFESGTLTLTNSTISGDIYAGSGNPDASFLEVSVRARASIVNGECEVGAGAVTWGSDGYNIEGPGDTCGFDEATDQVQVSADDLALGPLQDNGGPTETRAIRASSVAIDVIREESCVDEDGNPLTTDQRGEPRPETGGTMCDVGAFEAQP